MKYTIICGNPVDGFELYGIFDSAADAVEFANNDADLPETWHVIAINEVKE